MAKNAGAARPKTKNDPKEIYLLAESFLAAGMSLSTQASAQLFGVARPQLGVTMGRADWHAIVPVFVVQEFALELYLKCLLELETGKGKTTHKTIELLDALPPAARDEVAKMYSEVLKRDPNAIRAMRERPTADWSIEGVAKECSDAFVKFRYLYEHRVGDALGSNSMLILNAVRRVIRKRKPEWPQLIGAPTSQGPSKPK